MAIENITVGTKAIARVGRNAIEVEVVALEGDGVYHVRNKNGKEFTARRIEPMLNSVAVEPAPKIIITPTASAEPEKTETPEKHLSLMDAALEVLKTSEHPLNTREMVKSAIEHGLWTSTGARTPEQTLYGAIFREIATKENPRIVKAEQRGKFQLA